MELEIVDINDIDISNMLLHFTFNDNLKSIYENGLLPMVGRNAFGLEVSAKIFFAKGDDGSAQILNNWIKWLIYKKQRYFYYKDAKTDEDYIRITEEFHRALLDGRLFNNSEENEEAFEYFYWFLTNSSHLLLNLEEGKDYLKDDNDEIKLRNLKNPKYIEVMYGKLTSLKGMEKWNMHTKEGIIIDSSKIKILIVDGKSDSLSVAQKLYELNKDNTNMDLTLLSEFFEYLNKKDKSHKR